MPGPCSLSASEAALRCNKVRLKGAKSDRETQK